MRVWCKQQEVSPQRSGHTIWSILKQLWAQSSLVLYHIQVLKISWAMVRAITRPQQESIWGSSPVKLAKQTYQPFTRVHTDS